MKELIFKIFIYFLIRWDDRGLERNLAKVEVEGSNPFARSKSSGSSCFFTTPS